MQAFWESLSLLQKVLYCIAVPSTLVVILQIILLFLGFGEDGAASNPSDTSGLDLDTPADAGLSGADFDMADGDMVMDGSNPADFGTLRLFTLQGILAFLCVFSWSGIALSKTALPILFSLMLATLLGFLFMVLIATLIHYMSRLTDDGSVSIHSALGRSGTVYLTIPPRGAGHGKVNITIGGHFYEYDAITDSEISLPTGSHVRVVDVREDVVMVEAE